MTSIDKREAASRRQVSPRLPTNEDWTAASRPRPPRHVSDCEARRTTNEVAVSPTNPPQPQTQRPERLETRDKIGFVSQSNHLNRTGSTPPAVLPLAASAMPPCRA